MRLFYQLFLLFIRRPEVWVAAFLGKDFHYPIQRDNSGESPVFGFLSVLGRRAIVLVLGCQRSRKPCYQGQHSLRRLSLRFARLEFSFGCGGDFPSIRADIRELSSPGFSISRSL